MRQLAGECELTGKRTLFQRNGRAVAILISYDEWLAMRETLDLANDPAMRRTIDAADGEIGRGAMLLAEDLLVE